MKPYRKHHPRDAAHPSGKPEPRRHCRNERRKGRAAMRRDGVAEAEIAIAEAEAFRLHVLGRRPVKEIDAPVFVIMDSRAAADFDAATCMSVCYTLDEAKREAPDYGDGCCVFEIVDGAPPSMVWQHRDAQGCGEVSP